LKYKFRITNVFCDQYVITSLDNTKCLSD